MKRTMPETAKKTPPVFRFAPSPNGLLHLGHALSALTNQDMAKSAGGRLLLRIEDIDITRCRPEFETAIHEDLAWLGVTFESPVRRQSAHTDDYREALERLKAMDLVYPAFSSRGEVKAFVADYERDGATWPRDPDGSPLYPPPDRERTPAERAHKIAAGEKHAWRLDITRAVKTVRRSLAFRETGDAGVGMLTLDPAVWGDVMLWRSDAPSSYHLSVTVDDALQGVTHVVRGLDLFAATPVHRLLQELLGLAAPTYHHHRLVLDGDGHKLSKSRKDTALAELRASGLSPTAIRALAGLD
jgi:glutamyl-Q tRNA(Asp) synthetase